MLIDLLLVVLNCNYKNPTAISTTTTSTSTSTLSAIPPSTSMTIEDDKPDGKSADAALPVDVSVDGDDTVKVSPIDTFGSLHIWESDIDAHISPSNGWLKQSHLDMMLIHLRVFCLPRNLQEHMFFANSLVWQLWHQWFSENYETYDSDLNSSLPSTVVSQLNLDISNFKVIFVPLNFHDSHYSMFINIIYEKDEVEEVSVGRSKQVTVETTYKVLTLHVDSYALNDSKRFHNCQSDLIIKHEELQGLLDCWIKRSVGGGPNSWIEITDVVRKYVLFISLVHILTKLTGTCTIL